MLCFDMIYDDLCVSVSLNVIVTIFVFFTLSVYRDFLNYIPMRFHCDTVDSFAFDDTGRGKNGPSVSRRPDSFWC